MNVFVFICIGVEYLGTFCSVLFGFRKCNKINYIAHPLRIPWISVTSTTGTSFFHFWSINPIKAMRALDLPMFLYGAETYRCPSSAPRATDTRLPLASLRLRGGAYRKVNCLFRTRVQLLRPHGPAFILFYLGPNRGSFVSSCQQLFTLLLGNSGTGEGSKMPNCSLHISIFMFLNHWFNTFFLFVCFVF